MYKTYKKKFDNLWNNDKNKKKTSFIDEYINCMDDVYDKNE